MDKKMINYTPSSDAIARKVVAEGGSRAEICLSLNITPIELAVLLGLGLYYDSPLMSRSLRRAVMLGELEAKVEREKLLRKTAYGSPKDVQSILKYIERQELQSPPIIDENPCKTRALWARMSTLKLAMEAGALSFPAFKYIIETELDEQELAFGDELREYIAKTELKMRNPV